MATGERARKTNGKFNENILHPLFLAPSGGVCACMCVCVYLPHLVSGDKLLGR